jgi:hypothetical protein
VYYCLEVSLSPDEHTAAGRERGAFTELMLGRASDAAPATFFNTLTDGNALLFVWLHAPSSTSSARSLRMYGTSTARLRAALDAALARAASLGISPGAVHVSRINGDTQANFPFLSLPLRTQRPEAAQQPPRRDVIRRLPIVK